MTPRYGDKYDDPLFDEESDIYGDYDADGGLVGFYIYSPSEEEDDDLED
jgi:hypothetical protein